jgi:hypothetical protein
MKKSLVLKSVVFFAIALISLSGCSNFIPTATDNGTGLPQKITSVTTADSSKDTK